MKFLPSRVITSLLCRVNTSVYCCVVTSQLRSTTTSLLCGDIIYCGLFAPPRPAPKYSAILPFRFPCLTYFVDLPSSVYSSKFYIPQALYLPLLCASCIPDVSAGRKHRGCGRIFPKLELLWLRQRCELLNLFKPFLFRPLQTLLQPQKNQPLYFQSIPNSFAKTPGGGGTSRSR